MKIRLVYKIIKTKKSCHKSCVKNDIAISIARKIKFNKSFRGKPLSVVCNFQIFATPCSYKDDFLLRVRKWSVVLGRSLAYQTSRTVKWMYLRHPHPCAWLAANWWRIDDGCRYAMHIGDDVEDWRSARSRDSYVTVMINDKRTSNIFRYMFYLFTSALVRGCEKLS